MTDTDKLYKIKPLEWRYYQIDDSCEAETPFGCYQVYAHWWGFSAEGHYGSVAPSPCASIEAGKAAAEAHWRERILPMLEEVE